MAERTVGIVGAGPAGKAAARELAKEGMRVTLYEKEQSSGGLMRFGYPSFRMPTAVSVRDAEALAALGIETKTGQELGRNVDISDLTARHDAVLLTIGAPVAKRLGIPGENLTGVYDALSFLYASRIEQPFPVGKRVLVVGGGDTSIDAATTSIFLGAKSAVIAYRGAEEKLPALPHEVATARERGVTFRFNTRIDRIARATADTLGVFLTDSGETEEFDNVIVAIGQDLDASFLTALGIQVRPDGTTNLPAVFVAGGVLYGSDRLSHAILDGRRAAKAILASLS